MTAVDCSQPPKNCSPFVRLQAIVSTLRGANGCPWDIQQTPVSLKKYLLEECRELAEAIDNGNPGEIQEEIGDLFFILTLLSEMFAEQHRFTADEALEGIIAKMIRRHPHVFAGVAIADEHELHAQWQRIKAQEKQNPSTPIA